MDNKELIIQYCKELGLDIVGFTECRIYSELQGLFQARKEKNIENEFEEQDVEKRINPFIYMAEGKTIISIAFPYFFKGLVKEKVCFSRYTLGQDYHRVLGEYLKKITAFIEGLGGKATSFVDSNALPERYIAFLSDVGFIGKNNMLITEKYGSYVFLGEIITDLDLLTSEEKENIFKYKVNKIEEFEKCSNCELCIKTCPTKSLKQKDNCKTPFNNPDICLSYITQKKHIEDKWFNVIEGRIWGCDDCQDVCPYNENAEESNIEEFKPRLYMKLVDLKELCTLTNEQFKEKYSNTSCSWRGKNIIIRNALIAASNTGQRLQLGEIKSPYVKDYYCRLFNNKDL
jgi:epoxyqueuosine reductase